MLIFILLLIACSKEVEVPPTYNVVLYSSGAAWKIQIKGVHWQYLVEHSDFVPSCLTPGFVNLDLKKGSWDLVFVETGRIVKINIKEGCNAIDVSKL